MPSYRGMRWYNMLHTFCPIWRANGFRNVVAYYLDASFRKQLVTIPGVCYSEYSSGPSMTMLANAVAEMVRSPDVIMVGLESCEPLGHVAWDIDHTA